MQADVYNLPRPTFVVRDGDAMLHLSVDYDYDHEATFDPHIRIDHNSDRRVRTSFLTVRQLIEAIATYKVNHDSEADQ